MLFLRAVVKGGTIVVVFHVLLIFYALSGLQLKVLQPLKPFSNVVARTS